MIYLEKIDFRNKGKEKRKFSKGVINKPLTKRRPGRVENFMKYDPIIPIKGTTVTKQVT